MKYFKIFLKGKTKVDDSIRALSEIGAIGNVVRMDISKTGIHLIVAALDHPKSLSPHPLAKNANELDEEEMLRAPG